MIIFEFFAAYSSLWANALFQEPTIVKYHMGLISGVQVTELHAWLSVCDVNNRCAVATNGL